MNALIVNQMDDSILHATAQTNLKYVTVDWERIGCDGTSHYWLKMQISF
jgi:hypothetical protein